MRISEIYCSLQGEGRWTGTQSVFVRASGCNLRCWFCDTPYASWKPTGEDLSVNEIVRQVLDHNCDDVVLTGGEPMLFAEATLLCQQLKEAGRRITVETAGTLYLPVICDLMSISPKLQNSTPSPQQAGKWAQRHEQTRHASTVIRRLIHEYDYQFKFVIDQPADCDEVERYLREFPDVARQHVWLMPQGTSHETLSTISEWLEPYCQTHGYRFCPRKQIEWFGAVRGT